MLNTLFDALATAERASVVALDLEGRSLTLNFASVTDNLDPKNLRRLKVTTEADAGLIETDWLMHLNPYPGIDAPLPVIGSSVVVGFFDGDPHDGLWLGPVHNDTNAVHPKGSITQDKWEETPGNSTRKIEGGALLKTGDDLTLKSTAILHVYPETILEDYLRLPLKALPATPLNRGKLSIQRGLPGLIPDKLVVCLNNGNGLPELVVVAEGAPYNPNLPIGPDLYLGYPDKSDFSA